MLKCVLGDGSVFEDDRDKLSDISELIKNMLDDPLEKSNLESDDSDDTIVRWEEVPLPLVPSYQRMKNVVEDTKDLPLMDLIYKINDADYLNCKGVMETCFSEFVEIIENGTEEVLETIVEHTVPTVLGSVLLCVNCIPIIQNCLNGFNSFPLPFHLQTILQGCGILHSSEYLKFHFVCKIMLYCVSIAPNEKSEKYINEYITTIRNIINGNFSDHSTKTMIYGTIINDISLVRQIYNSYGFSRVRLNENYELVNIAASMGRMEIIEILLEGENHFTINNLVGTILNSACSAGLTYFSKQLMNKFVNNPYIPSLNPDALLFLLKENFKFKDSQWLHSSFNSVLYKAVEEDNIEFCKMISKREDFVEIMECGRDNVCILSRCTNYEIMKALYEGYSSKDNYTLENWPQTRLWSPITKKKYNWIFGTLENKYEVSPRKILREVLLDLEENS